MRFICDNCGLRFEHELFHDGESCLSCNDGTIEIDIETMDDDEVATELASRLIDDIRIAKAFERVKEASVVAKERAGERIDDDTMEFRMKG